MKALLYLTKRNLLMFFRSKSEVFFSFLSIIIIIGLYVLFLSDVQVKSIEQSVGQVEGIKPLVNSWVMAGLIAVSTVTLSLGALGRIVADKQNKALDDFLVAPINRTQVFLSYILSTLIITIVLSFIMLVISEIYIATSGGHFLNIVQFTKVVGIMILCVLSSSLLMLFIVSFLKNEQSFSLLSSIIGTMIGFITSAYIPVGIMPKGVQFFSNVIPISQGAALLRKVILENPVNIVFKNHLDLKSDYLKLQGVNLYWGDYELTTTFMIMFIIGSIVLFAILNIIRFRKLKNNQ